MTKSEPRGFYRYLVSTWRPLSAGRQSSLPFIERGRADAFFDQLTKDHPEQVTILRDRQTGRALREHMGGDN